MEFEYTIDADTVLAMYAATQQASESGGAETKKTFRKGLQSALVGVGILVFCLGLWSLDRLGWHGLGGGLALYFLPVAGLYTYVGVMFMAAQRRKAGGPVPEAVRRAVTSEKMLGRRTGVARVRVDESGITTEFNGEVHVIGPRAVEFVRETEEYLFIQSRAWWMVAVPRRQVKSEVVAEVKRVVEGWGLWSGGRWGEGLMGVGWPLVREEEATAALEMTWGVDGCRGMTHMSPHVRERRVRRATTVALDSRGSASVFKAARLCQSPESWHGKSGSTLFASASVQKTPM